jgi:3-methyladenine DNA glycosylase/8-oxoguanine DNA glycosylase
VPSEESYALAQQVLDETTAVLAAAGAAGPEAVDLYTALMSGMATQQVSNDPGGTRWARLVDEACPDVPGEPSRRGRLPGVSRLLAG